MAEYLLYGFAQSGNSYKPALYLELAGADWTPRFVDFFNGETRTPAYRQINVMGEVPVLEHKGQHLTQSGVILDYLLEQFGKYGWNGDGERREILRWLLWDNHKLTSYTATYRFLRVLMPNPNPVIVEEFRKRAESSWKILDTQLSGRRYLVGDRLTVADISACGYLFSTTNSVWTGTSIRTCVTGCSESAPSRAGNIRMTCCPAIPSKSVLDSR
jgi:glutathione S-transferase